MELKRRRLDLRITGEQNAVLQSAPEACDEATSDSVLRNALDSARPELADLHVFVASESQWSGFEAVLERDITLNATMISLLTAPSALEQ